MRWKTTLAITNNSDWPAAHRPPVWSFWRWMWNNSMRYSGSYDYGNWATKLCVWVYVELDLMCAILLLVLMIIRVIIVFLKWRVCCPLIRPTWHPSVLPLCVFENKFGQLYLMVVLWSSQTFAQMTLVYAMLAHTDSSTDDADTHRQYKSMN